MNIVLVASIALIVGALVLTLVAGSSSIKATLKRYLERATRAK